MKSLWNDQEAANYQGDLGLRVYTSRLLGRDPSLVLHGGGNTSVKVQERNLVGETEDILYVKGSGWDLATIEAAGFAPVRMPHLLKLAQLPTLSDPQMVNELKTQMTVASAPTPSVETILHAILPYKYVDHTHADAIVTITNTPEGEARIKEIYGDRLVIIPYIMPGFDLARLCAEKFAAEAHAQTEGMILLNHGIFSFGATAKEAYELMIKLVNEAEEYLQQKNAWHIPLNPIKTNDQSIAKDLAQLRFEVSQVAGFPVIMTGDRRPEILNFTQRQDLRRIAQQNPATPDHVIRTKPLPLIGRDVATYTKQYAEYFYTQAPNAREPKTMLDTAPRVILDPELGLLAIGQTAKAANIVKDIYEHTIEIISRAELLSSYQALSQKDIFDMEYWDLEQAKLKKGGTPPEFTGAIALVTGAASGIGKACVASLLKRGAAVVGLDINPAVEEILGDRPDFYGITCDLTNEKMIADALEKAVQKFGGIDMVILNAGIFPPSRLIADLSSDQWDKVLNINLDSNLILLRECYPFLKLAPKGGRVVMIGSKNVAAPGQGVAAYSVSKAALNQLARVAALEWGNDGIRINTVHPNAVFDTEIWTEEILQKRATAYGLSVEDYKKNNVLKVEITSHDVAELTAAMCGQLFAKTTAAQIPIDGGNERVI